MRSLGWAPIWYDRCPYERKSEHRPLQREEAPILGEEGHVPEHPEQSFHSQTSEGVNSANTMILDFQPPEV